MPQIPTVVACRPSVAKAGAAIHLFLMFRKLDCFAPRAMMVVL